MDEVKNSIISIYLTSKEQTTSLFLWDCWAPDQHQFHSNGHSVFCFIIYIYLNSKYFPLIHSRKKIQTNCLFFSFKYNIKISFSATPLGASLKFLMSHHLCSIHGGFPPEREVGTRWRGCFHQRRIVPGWQSSQEYMMCFRRRGKAKIGKILLLWVSAPPETLLTNDMFQITWRGHASKRKLYGF